MWSCGWVSSKTSLQLGFPSYREKINLKKKSLKEIPNSVARFSWLLSTPYTLAAQFLVRKKKSKSIVLL